MAYFPASCNYDCKDCSQNKCGWCAFLDCPCPCMATLAETINPYNYSTTITSEEMKEEEIKKSSHELIEAVEKYIQPKKGEFLSRNDLLTVLRKVKKIIYEDK